MSVVVGKKFIPYKAAPPEALATSSSFDEYLVKARAEDGEGDCPLYRYVWVPIPVMNVPSRAYVPCTRALHTYLAGWSRLPQASC